MEIQEMLNDEIRPTCPKCGGENFAAVLNRNVLRTTEGIPMIICANTGCRAAIGVLPMTSVFPDFIPDA